MILKYNNLKPISGDASYRIFFRKFDKEKKKSSIVIFSKKEKKKNLLIYSAINHLINKNNLLAPKLISQNYKNNFIEVSDFGDLTFHKILNTRKNKFDDYKKIVDLLIKFQKIKDQKIKNFNKKYYWIPKYSLNLLTKESDLFFTWYLPLILSKTKIKKIKNILRPKLNILYKKLKLKNDVFVHRDFHISNLMRYKKKIAIIDAQDAVIGNPAYDLVSLVDDVRIKTSNSLKNKILNYYLKKCPKKISLKKKEFIHDFCILSVQRNFKILGIFSRLFKRDKKGNYLKLLPYTWKLLNLRMKNNKNFNNLFNYLDKIISVQIRDKKFNES